MGLDGVLSDLEAAGYEVWPVVISACAPDALPGTTPHRRDRVWLIAHAHYDRGRYRPHRGPQPAVYLPHTAISGTQLFPDFLPS